MDTHSDFYIKAKATLWTAIIIVWFVFFAYKLEWIFAVHKNDESLEDAMELSLGNTAEEAIYNEVLNSQPIAPPPVAESVAPPAPVESSEETPPDIETDHQGEAVALPPPPVEKKEEKKIIKPAPEKKIVKKETKKIVKKETKKVVAAAPVLPAPKPTPVRPVPAPKAVFSGKISAPTAAKNRTANPFASATHGKVIGQTGTPSGRAGAAPNAHGPGGSGGGSGMQLSKNLSGRKIAHMPSFKDKFTQSGNMRIEVRVNNQGVCSFMRVIRSNVADVRLLQIVKNKIQQMRFAPTNKDDEDDIGYIDFHFKITQ